MRWIDQYELFLFDLDGLLVNTEMIHHRAYVAMCKARGYELSITFDEYFAIAQSDAKGPENFIYKTFPKLQKEEPNWKVLYAEKKRAFLDILQKESAPLLEGVETILKALERANKKRCVVTHSPKELVDLLRKQNPILHSIPNWITREDYTHPKPHPDGYLLAIERFAEKEDRIIGFEDSSRGMRALMATRATPILVNSIDVETRALFDKEGVKTFRTLQELINRNTL